MTNMQIIVNSAVEHGLYSEAEVEELFVAMGCLPLFTFAEWKKRGYSVKKRRKGENDVLHLEDEKRKDDRSSEERRRCGSR